MASSGSSATACLGTPGRPSGSAGSGGARRPAAAAIRGMRDASSSPFWLLFWLGVALLAHTLVALFAVLSRWAQTRLAPPFPALRLALLLNLIALAALLALEAAAAAARWLRVRLAPWARRRRGTSSGGERGAAGEQGTTPVEGKSGSCSGGGAGAVTGAAAGPLQLGEVNGADAACEEQQQQGRSAPGDPLARGDTLYGRRDGAPQRPGVPDVYLQRGLSRRVRSLQDRRPRAVRLGALALLSATYALGSTSQIAAAGYIDASLLQLVMMFTVVGVAAVQALLLRHRLPLLLWPCAALMLGGSAMVLAPAFGGSANFVTLQASRSLGFTAAQLQLSYLPLTILALLPLSLPIDGAEWGAQMGGYSGAQWALLVAASTVVYLGGNFALQNATWQLGAPLTSLLYGFRLVAAIVEQQLILGTVVVSSGLQIAGVCVTLAAVTAFMAWRWRAARLAGAA